MALSLMHFPFTFTKEKIKKGQERKKYNLNSKI